MATDVAKLILDARTSRGWSQERLGTTAKVGQSTIDRIERGAVVKADTLAKVLAALDLTNEPTVSPALNIRSSPRFFTDRAVMPVFSSAEGGSGALIISNEPYEYLPKPYTLQAVEQAFAVLIEGESMVPAFEPGDKVWVNPMLSHRRNTDVILCSDQGFVGKALIKRLLGFTDTQWRVSQYNPVQDFALDRREWTQCLRVVGKFSRDG